MICKWAGGVRACVTPTICKWDANRPTSTEFWFPTERQQDEAAGDEICKRDANEVTLTDRFSEWPSPLSTWPSSLAESSGSKLSLESPSPSDCKQPITDQHFRPHSIPQVPSTTTTTTTTRKQHQLKDTGHSSKWRPQFDERCPKWRPKITPKIIAQRQKNGN